MFDKSKCEGIITINIERTQIHILSDVLVAVALLDLKVPNKFSFWPYNKSLEYWPSLFHEDGWVFMVLASLFFSFLLRFNWPISSKLALKLGQ